MIISRIPLRISSVGGGSDLPAFYLQEPGAVVGTAVNKSIYITVNPIGKQDQYTSSNWMLCCFRQAGSSYFREIGVTPKGDVGS